MKTFYAKSQMKLSTFLLEEYSGEMSYSAFCKILRKKDIKVDGKRVNKDVVLIKGQKVDVYFQPRSDYEPYAVVFEDENVLILDKDKGITSDRLFELLSKKYSPLYYCHRLDRNTDGIIVFAKNEQAYESLYSGFKHRKFDKTYYALVYGKFDCLHAVFRAYLYKDSENSVVIISKSKTEGAKEIVTEYTVVSESGDVTALLVKPVSGRTHQIRAHLSYLGHFVLGDGKYGNDSISKSFGYDKLQLTSVKITFSFDKADYLYYLSGKSFIKRDFSAASYLQE